MFAAGDLLTPQSDISVAFCIGRCANLVRGGRICRIFTCLNALTTQIQTVGRQEGLN